MTDDLWGRHEVERLLSLAPRSDDGQWSPTNDALIFFKDRVDYEVMMSLLVTEWRRIEGVKNYFKHERARLVEAAVKNAPHAERIRVLLEDMISAALETRKDGIEDPTLPPLEAITGIELVRDVLEEYPAKTKAFMALYDLTIEEIERIDTMRRWSIGHFAWQMYCRVGHSHDGHIAALIGPVIGWPRLKAETVRNCLNAFRKTLSA
jgi:hypothetical protein